MVAPEPELLREVLDWHRSTLLYKCAGLTGEQLAQVPITGSNLSLLGLIRHLAKVERIWYQRYQRQPDERLYSTAERPDADFEDIDANRAEAEYAVLLAEQESARQVLAGAPLSATLAHRDGTAMSARMLLIHLIGEYARHNGHADLLRQSVDGVTGA
jgi:uncharacterized damage-inducible protein DinB